MLQSTYDKKDDIPEAFREIYSERDGKWEVTGIKGVATDATVKRLEGALARTKEERNEAKTKLAAAGEATPERISELEASLEEANTKLELAGKAPEDFDAKLQDLAEKRARTLVAPIERENTKLKTRSTELESEVGSLSTTVQNRLIDDDLRAAAAKLKVVPSAIADILLYRGMFQPGEDGRAIAREGSGIVEGTSAEEWLTDQPETRPHWWPASKGGGALGGGPMNGLAKNPWSPKNWNATDQGRVVREQGMEKATAMAEQADSKVGAARPTPKAD